MAQYQKEPFGNRPHFKTTRHIAIQWACPFMGGVAVQVDMQLGTAGFDRLFADRMLERATERLALQVIAKGGVARGVVHMPRLSGDKTVLQCVTVRVF